MTTKENRKNNSTITTTKTIGKRKKLKQAYITKRIQTHKKVT